MTNRIGQSFQEWRTRRQERLAPRDAARAARAAEGDRMPWAFVIGLVLLVLGVLGAANAGGPGWALPILLGIVLIPTGLIQRSIEKSRRQ